MLAALRERWLTFSRQASTTKLWLQASPCQRLSVSGLPGSAAAPAISVPLPLTSSQIDQEKSAACSPMISRKNNGQQVGHCHNHSSFLCFPLIPGALFISNRNLFYINFTPSDHDLLVLFPSRLKKKKKDKNITNSDTLSPVTYMYAKRAPETKSARDWVHSKLPSVAQVCCSHCHQCARSAV